MAFEVCRKLRQESRKHTPVLMLTARDALDRRSWRASRPAPTTTWSSLSRCRRLEARIQVLVRRSKPQQARVLQVADLSYNLDTLVVGRQGKNIQLNPIALKILQCLMEASPSVVTRQELEMRVWGEELPDSDSLRVHIHTLRAAIDKPFDKPLIQTRHGIGYRLVDPEAAS
jgi:DNA-binding response OmpR family regulator